MKLLLGPPAKKRTRRVKRLSCQHCGEKFTSRSQLTKHINQVHKQSSDDAAISGAVPAGSEGEIHFEIVRAVNLPNPQIE